MVAPSVMTTAAGETGHAALGKPDSRVAFPAGGAAEGIAAFLPPLLKGELMRATLSRNPKIATSLPPLDAMRLQTATAMTLLGQQMGQFMQKGFSDFLLGNFTESGIEPDLGVRGNRHTGSRSHPGIPADDKSPGESGSEGMKMLSRFFLQLRVSLTSELVELRFRPFASKQAA
jgi:hypothetical protein